MTLTFVKIFCRTFARASAIEEALTVVTLCAGYFAPGESSSHFTRYVAMISHFSQKNCYYHKSTYT